MSDNRFSPPRNQRLPLAFYRDPSRVVFITIRATRETSPFAVVREGTSEVERVRFHHELCERVLSCLAGSRDKYRCDVFIACLMPDHLHLLAHPREPTADVLTMVDRFKGEATHHSWEGFAQLSYALIADPAITPAEKVVLAALLRFGWKRGRCFPANGTIAGAAGVSARTVGRVLPKLMAKGLISIEPTKANPTRRIIMLTFMGNPAIHPERAPRVSPARPSPLPRQPARAVTRPSCPPPYVAKVAEVAEEVSAPEKRDEKTDVRPPSLERRAPAEASRPREGDRLTGPELATFRKALEHSTGSPADGPRLPTGGAPETAGRR